MTDDIDTHGIRPAAFIAISILLLSSAGVCFAIALFGVLSK